MTDENLEHLLPRKAEINGVSSWASVKLRYIREDLAPLIEKGIPIKHLLRLLEPLEITRRRETVRQFLIDEFPEEYARYYAKKVTAERIMSGDDVGGSPPEAARKKPERVPINPTLETAETVRKDDANRQAKRLNIDDMAKSMSDFSNGKALETNESGD